MFNIKLPEDKKDVFAFSDVKSSDWFYDSVRIGYATGITADIGNGLFAPNQSITREQMVAMMVRAANIQKISLATTEKAGAFVDQAAISPWAQDAIRTLKALKIVAGTSNDCLLY